MAYIMAVYLEQLYCNSVCPFRMKAAEGSRQDEHDEGVRHIYKFCRFKGREMSQCGSLCSSGRWYLISPHHAKGTSIRGRRR